MINCLKLSNQILKVRRQVYLLNSKNLKIYLNALVRSLELNVKQVTKYHIQTLIK